MMVMQEGKWNRTITVDISGHHALCELNFHRLLTLMPGHKPGEDSGDQEWSFHVGAARSIKVCLRVVETAPYTTTLEILQNHAMLATPRILIRLYHDVSMAEVVAWDKHRHWHPQYTYPNANMYHPDEKLALNQFLGEWLAFCIDQGYTCQESCDAVLVNRK